MGEQFKVYSDFNGWEKLVVKKTLESAYVSIKCDNNIGKAHYLIVTRDTDKNMDSEVRLIYNENDLMLLESDINDSKDKPKSKIKTLFDNNKKI